ncbi:MAG TPA: TspO/MBR family protein [Candidatus Paceibacterota bacterium]|nr:TspO/MBR family protein [Candidatus Paceibacterota bacterium]
MSFKNALALVGWILLAEAAGAVGSLVTVPSILAWYATLARPELAPPNWVFGPVWTTLFLLMGIAAFLVWRTRTRAKGSTKALWAFAIQLALNVLWSFLFFGLHSPGGAFVEIILLWAAILYTIVLFAKVSKPAAYLLIPYIAWVSFAGYLNFMIWVLNS